MPYSLGCPASRRSSQSPPQSAPPSCRTPLPSPQFRCPSAAGCGRISSSSSFVSFVYAKTPDVPCQVSPFFLPAPLTVVASGTSPPSRTSPAWSPLLRALLRAVLHRFTVGSGRHAHCTVHIKDTPRETQGTSTEAPILPWTKVPTFGGRGMVHSARGPMAQVCHTLWQVRVPKALGAGGGRAW